MNLIMSRNFILQKISKIFILQFLNNQNYFVSEPHLHIDTEFAKLYFYCLEALV